MAGGSVAIVGESEDNAPSALFSNAFAGGDAGRFVVSTPTLTLDEGLIQAVATRGTRGNAGSIEVNVGRLTLTNGAQISSSTRSEGHGGDVLVTATDTIAIAGHDVEGFASGLFSNTNGAGPGGDLRVVTPHLQLSDGGTISARSTGAGDAGRIRLQVGETFQSQNGSVTTETTGAGGGAIALTASSLVHLIDSELTTSVRGGRGDAGNITIDPEFVILEGSRIIANAFEGRGGNILIEAGVFLADPNSLVDASSALVLQWHLDPCRGIMIPRA